MFSFHVIVFIEYIDLIQTTKLKRHEQEWEVFVWISTQRNNNLTKHENDASVTNQTDTTNILHIFHWYAYVCWRWCWCWCWCWCWLNWPVTFGYSSRWHQYFTSSTLSTVLGGQVLHFKKRMSVHFHRQWINIQHSYIGVFGLYMNMNMNMTQLSSVN